MGRSCGQGTSGPVAGDRQALAAGGGAGHQVGAARRGHAHAARQVLPLLRLRQQQPQVRVPAARRGDWAW